MDQQTRANWKEDVKNIMITIAQSWIDEGIEIGIKQGFVRGQTEMLRANIARIGRRRLGEPGETALALLRSMTDLDRLDHLFDRVQEVSSWDELFC
jgi:hypothetical protein